MVSALQKSVAKLRLSPIKMRAVVISGSLSWQSEGVRKSKDTPENTNLPVFCVDVTAPRGECRGCFNRVFEQMGLLVSKHLRLAVGKSPVLLE